MTDPQTLTHEQLTVRAARWLKSNGHIIVLRELVFGDGAERPDAFGWKAGHSTLIECKRTRSDFLADIAKKLGRQSRP